MPKATGKKSSSSKAKPARKAGAVKKTAVSGKSSRKQASSGKKPARGKPAAKKAVQKKSAVRKTASRAASKPKAAASGKPAPRGKTVSAQKTGRRSPAPASRKTVEKKTLPAAQKTAAQAPQVSGRLQSLRKTLLERREGIVREAKQEIAKYISGETRQLVDTAIDEGDWAVVDISEDISLRRLSAHRKLLLDIDEALRKIREGTYGICEECGEEIAEKRLLVLPTATLCVDCKENREKFEALEEKEEI